MLKLLSYSLRLQKDPTKLGIKAKGPKGPRTRIRVRGLSPPQKPRTLPRPRKQRLRIKKLILRLRTLPSPRKLKLRQRKQRPRLKKLILRPRTPLPPNRARKKLLLLQRPRLST